ncbi:MAG TPA: ATP-binding cassette domain-containing protein [Bryobacteraceae bacterium]|nr:ATP-binding cassette domain-containing protein [Bryobacteraceae bacterium]
MAEFSFFRRTRLLLAFIAMAVPLEAILVVLLPGAVYFFIDRIVPAPVLSTLYLMLGIIAGAALLGLAAGFLADNLAARAQSRCLAELRLAMYDKLQRISMSHHAPDQNAALTGHFSGDLASIETALAHAASRGLLPVVQALLCTGLMFWLDWRAAFAGLLLWPWIILAPAASASHGSRMRDAAKEGLNSLLSLVKESLEAQAAIRVFSLEHTGVAGFRKRNDLVSRAALKADLRAAFMERFAAAGIPLIQLLLLAVGAGLVFYKQMTLGVFAALQIFGYVLSGSLVSAAGFLPVFARAREAYARIGELLQPSGAIEDMDGARYLPSLHSEIGFSEVRFRYGSTTENSDEKEAISGITARIPRGTWVAFVGVSGSGKSTILKLLMRFYDPSSGRITIDGHDLKSVTQASLRGRLGVVLQENSLFNISIRENIRLAKPDASEESLATAARIAGLHDMIMSLPQGYDTLVGQNNVGPDSATFSAGGVQRLALARAILREPDILLLDEATSALDPVEEAAVSAIIEGLRKGRTMISAAHRLSTTAGADHIFVLDNGLVVEQGSHFELMALDGMYAYLWRKQAGFRFSADGAHVDVDGERLKAFPILENLDDAALSELAPFFATETFLPGREIVRQGDPGDKFYIIARGQVEVRRTEEISGQIAEVAVLQDGDFFGEITLLTGFPRIATVRTLTVCTCISLERGHFTRLLDRFPELKREVSAIALKRLRETTKFVAA